MTAAEPPAASMAAADTPIPAWRYNTGLGLFILGNILFVASPVLVPAFGLGASYIAIGIILAEVIMFSSVFFLGWTGLKQLKNKLFGFLKVDPHARPVGRFRHRLGIFMTFVLSIGLDVLAVVLVFVSLARTTPADPFPVVWGMAYDTLVVTIVGMFIASYVTFVAGLFVLGDHWWGRFRQLFLWQGDEP